MSRLIGVDGLIADPSLEGGGLHQSTTGGFLNIHADFTVHPHNRKWQRRANILLYLNDDWKPEYGGDLELWSADMKECVEKVAPVANRVLIFTTDGTSFHGHPEPMPCPEGVARRSLALYYFTLEEDPVVRSTEYRARPGDGFHSVMIYADKQLLRPTTGPSAGSASPTTPPAACWPSATASGARAPRASGGHRHPGAGASRLRDRAAHHRDRGPEPAQPGRDQPPAVHLAVLVGTAVVLLPLLCVLWDLWNGSVNPLRGVPYDNFYDLQARAMFHGHLNLPPGNMGIEAFVHDGRQYTYFGIFPSLLRMPFLLVTTASTGG